MKKKRKWIRGTVVPLLLVALMAGFIINRGPAEVDPTAAPAWKLRDLKGNEVTWADFKGKVVAVNFWATWCPPCRMEIPGFVELQEKYEDDEFVIVGISMDDLPASDVAAFAEEMEINYPVVMGDAAVASAFGGIRALPTTFIIDRDGMIRNVQTGYLTKRAFESALEPLL